MPDYTRGKVYKITSDKGPLIYIGSTCKKYLCSRLACHKSHYDLYKEGNPYFKSRVFKIFDEYGPENCKIELIEAINAQDKNQLREREKYYIETTENIVNKNIPGRTKEESMKAFRDKNPDYYKIHCKEWYEKNREKQLECKPCECGGRFSMMSKKQHEKSSRHQNFVKSKTI